MGDLTRQEKRRLERAGKLANSPKAHTIIGGKVINLRECLLRLRLDHPKNQLGAPTGLDITAVVDTGATNSAISQSIVNALNLPVIGKTRIGTAGGSHEVDVVAARVVLPCHHSPQTTFSKVIPLTVVDMVGQMLFGMDLLADGVLTVDMCSGTWEWKLMRTSQAPLVLRRDMGSPREGNAPA